MPDDHAYHAATSLLARMLTGIAATNLLNDPDAPDLAAASIEADGDTAVKARIQLPSGDWYDVRVEWLKAESP